MITVPQSDDHQPGTWKGLQTASGRKAGFTCPNGHTLSLRDYEITEEGYVHPSVLCPEDGCGFHEFIKLEGWSPS